MSVNVDLLNQHRGLVYSAMGKFGIHPSDRTSDLGQQIWLDLCKYIKNFDAEKGSLAGWIYRNVRGTRNRWYRKKYNDARLGAPVEDMDAFPIHSPRQSDVFLHAHILAVMEKTLSPSHLEIVQDVLIRKRSLISIARETGVSKTRIGTIVQRAKRILQVHLRNYAPEGWKQEVGI